jgi:hypothetical protein
MPLGIKATYRTGGGVRLPIDSPARGQRTLGIRDKMNEQLPSTPRQKSLQVSVSGCDLINCPRVNKGTAFSDHERDVFDLHGLLPPHVGNLDQKRKKQGVSRWHNKR